MNTRFRKELHHRTWMAFVVALLALSLGACTTVQPAPVTQSNAAMEQENSISLPEITITARDFAFDMPAEIPSGWVSLIMKNEGQVNHHGAVMRLLDGVSVDDAIAAMDNPDADQSQYTDLSFFLPDTDPGSSNQATVEMAPGHWVILSFSMDGASIGASEQPVPDFLLGSIQEFDVVDQGAIAPPPDADLAFTVGADDIEVPQEMEPGPHTIEVVNDSGQENGYAFILRIEGDATMDDILAAFNALFSGQEIDMSTMPVFHTVGGLMGYNLGDRYYTDVNLEPGNYTVVSSIGGDEFPYSGLSKNFTVPGDEAGAAPNMDADGSIPNLLIEVNDGGIIAPEVAPGGIVHILVNNTGEQPHGLELWRIKDGHTRDDVVAFIDHLKENPDDFFAEFDIASWVHYADYVEPGTTNEFYADLRTGEFFLNDDTIEIASPVFFSAPELVGVTEPQTDVLVDMTDFAYAMPDVIPAGEQLWEFTNSGDQWHLAAIINNDPDLPTEEILSAFDDSNEPPPADAPVQIFGGMPPMSPGERVWQAFDLEPGDYDLVCPLPDVEALQNGDGPPVMHLEHGMRRAFRVESQ